jgi:arylsulfatase
MSGRQSRLRTSISSPRGFVIVPAQAVVARWLESFKEFPIRQKPASFNLDEVMQKLTPKQ